MKKQQAKGTLEFITDVGHLILKESTLKAFRQQFSQHAFIYWYTFNPGDYEQGMVSFEACDTPGEYHDELTVFAPEEHIQKAVELIKDWNAHLSFYSVMFEKDKATLRYKISYTELF